MAFRNGPVVTNIDQVLIGSKVLVYRPELDQWDGSHDILRINGEDVTVLLLPPAGPSKFRSTVAKPYILE